MSWTIYEYHGEYLFNDTGEYLYTLGNSSSGHYITYDAEVINNKDSVTIRLTSLKAVSPVRYNPSTKHNPYFDVRITSGNYTHRLPEEGSSYWFNGTADGSGQITTLATKVSIDVPKTSSNVGQTTWFGVLVTYMDIGTAYSSIGFSMPPVYYDVTYQQNTDASVNNMPSNGTKNNGETYTISSSVPTRSDGYTFWHWNTSSNNSGTSYDSGGSYSGNADVTFYAIWNTTVSYNANGGSDAPSSQTKYYGSNLTLTTSKPTRSGYQFYHWNTASNNSGTSYDSGDTYSTHSPLTLYAIWNPQVTYNANGGTGAPSAEYKYYGRAYTLSSTVPTRPGYKFKGWNTKSDGTGTAYQPRGSYTENDPVTLYAIWNAIITYDANGGSGAPSSQTKTYGTALALSTQRPTRTNNEFVRWNTARDGSGTSYAPGASYASETSVTLYAIWAKDIAAPTISSLTAVRCNSAGGYDDGGEHCLVTATWSIDTSASGNTATAYGMLQVDGETEVTTFQFSSGASGTSGTARAIVAGVDADTQYVVGIVVTDSYGSTARTTILTRAYFVWDVRAGGRAMGIGSAAPQEGLEVGWPSQFDDDVTMLTDLAVTGDITVTGHISSPELTVNSADSDIFSASSGWAVIEQSAKTYGKVCSVYVKLRSTTDIAAKTSYSTSGMGSFASGYRPSIPQGFANAYGSGMVSSSGSASICNNVPITANSSDVELALTFLKA